MSERAWLFPPSGEALWQPTMAGQTTTYAPQFHGNSFTLDSKPRKGWSINTCWLIEWMKEAINWTSNKSSLTVYCFAKTVPLALGSTIHKEDAFPWSRLLLPLICSSEHLFLLSLWLSSRRSWGRWANYGGKGMALWYLKTKINVAS